MSPPPYPRVPHLVAGRGSRDDLVLGSDERDALLAGPVVVEEKLDGANVVVWRLGWEVKVALRSGEGGADRAGQLGPLRRWAAERGDALRTLLADGDALYAEWLLLTHTVAYDRLPAYLVALDLWHESRGFVALSERDVRCAAAGIAVVPEMWRGTPRVVGTVEGLITTSAYGDRPAEGVIVRAAGAQPVRLAKLIRPGFVRIGDDAWSAPRPRNRLADREASWH